MYYRLHVVQVRLPALRERKEDILVLADHLLQGYLFRNSCEVKGYSAQAKEMLLRYSFPGNVRELENTIERAVVLAQNRKEIEAWDLCGHQSCPFLGGVVQDGCGFCQEGLCESQPKSTLPLAVGQSSGTLAEAREHFERAYLRQQLILCGGKVGRLAERIGMERTHLYRKLNSLGVDFRQVSVDE